jgi:hypothetical protein
VIPPDVELVRATRSEVRNDFSRRTSHLFNRASDCRGEIEGATTQDHNALVTICPGPKGQNLLEGLATDHNCVNACDKLVVAMRFAAARRQKIQIVIRPRNEAVDAGADKNGC